MNDAVKGFGVQGVTDTQVDVGSRGPGRETQAVSEIVTIVSVIFVDVSYQNQLSNILDR